MVSHRGVGHKENGPRVHPPVLQAVRLPALADSVVVRAGLPVVAEDPVDSAADAPATCNR